MKTTAALRASLLISLLSFLWTGCSAGWKTIRQGSYQGMPYVVQERERSGAFASTNSLDWRIQLGKQKPVPVDAVTTDWGPPYSTDIYGAESYLFIGDGADTVYRSLPFTPGTTGVAHTMLYVSPSVLSEAEFEEFWHFMRDEWPALSKDLARGDLRGFPHIVGLVYGKQDQFKQTFQGKHNGQAMLLVIETDGRVRFMNDDKWHNESYSGIAEMVQMPGKRLLLDITIAHGGLTTDELSTFKDQRGTPVTAHFDVQPSNWATVQEQGRATRDLLTRKWKPMANGDTGSYLWLRDGGIAEEGTSSGPRSADWSYDALTNTVTIRSENKRTVYRLQRVSATELMMEDMDAPAGAAPMVWHSIE